jgi:acetyltransferase-like isoleucine patch superfamily enzyme
VKIGNEVLLGSRASIIPGKQVGDRAVVGAGSVVVANVPADVTVFGNPARLLSRHD